MRVSDSDTTSFTAGVDCIGQWMVDGQYQAVFNYYGDEYQDFSDNDDDYNSDEGPIFTTDGDPNDYYGYYPGYYDPQIGLHTVSDPHLFAEADY